MRSKYRIFTFIVPLLILLLICFIVLFSYVFSEAIKDTFLKKESLILIFLLLMIFSLWYMFYVFRFKCDIIIVNNDNIVIRKIFGLGSTIVISFNELEFVPSWEYVKIGTGAKLLIIKKGKRITELSDFSYSNYNELLKIIMKKATIRPFQTDSFFNRLKNAVRFS